MPQSTTILGDWYVNFLNIHRVQVLLCVSEKSRLCVLVPAKELAKFPQRLTQGVADTLEGIGIAEAAVKAEIDEMAQTSYAKITQTPASRSLLGTMIEYKKVLEWEWEMDRHDLMVIAQKNNTMISQAIDWKKPVEIAQQLFAVDNI